MAWQDYEIGDYVGKPFKGKVVWWTEGDLSSGTAGKITPATAGRVMKVSDVVNVARVETGDMLRHHRGIDSRALKNTERTAFNNTFHLEYIPHTDDWLITHLLELTSEGTVQALGFEIGADVDGTESSWYVLQGCKCNSVTINGSQGDDFVISADFSVASMKANIAEYQSAASSGPAGSLCVFNSAGTIQDAGGRQLAYITSAFSLTVNHNLEDFWNIGKIEKSAIVEGALDVSGTCDISFDHGGAMHVRDVIAGATEADVVFILGDSSPSLSIGDVYWDSATVDITNEQGGMVGSCPFTAYNVSVVTA